MPTRAVRKVADNFIASETLNENVWRMVRMNSGKRNQNIFLIQEIFIFLKTVTDLVNLADTGDIEFFVQFPGI